MKKKIFLIKIVLLFNLVIFYANFSYAQIILKNELIQKAKQIKTYKTTATFSYILNEKKYNGEKEIIFKEGKGVKVHSLIYPKQEKIYLFSSSYVWTYLLLENTVYKLDLNRLEKELGKSFVNEYLMNSIDIRRSFSYQGVEKETGKLIGAKYINGEEMYIFKVSVRRYSHEYKNLFYRNGKIWVGEDGLLRKMIVYDENQKEIFSTTFSDIIINPEIPDSEFQFTPPNNCKVIDITQDWLKRLELIKELKEKQQR